MHLNGVASLGTVVCQSGKVSDVGQLFPPKASVGMVYFLQVLRLYAHPIRIGETS